MVKWLRSAPQDESADNNIPQLANDNIFGFLTQT